jgi:zinc protease
MDIRRTARGAAALGAVLAALLAASAAPAAAQGPAASGASGGGIPRLTYEKYTLPNGLEVILHEDRSVPLVAVNTWYKVGSGDEKMGRTGFAHLFEHILFMGSQHVPVGAFDQWLEAAGANNNGSTWFDRTNYYEWMPSNALSLALWLDADRMGWLLPTMDQSKLDLQRDVVKNERRERTDNAPYGRAYETILAALYPPGHPYSWPTIGSMTDLSAASLEDVKQFFRTYYAPNNATLVIAGDFDRDSVKTWVQRYFGNIPRGPAMPARPKPAAFAVKDTFLVLEDRVQLPRVYDAWHTTKNYTADDAALQILATVLANDKNSRLYKRLVYEMQVAQDVGAGQEGYNLDGHFLVVVTPRPGQAPRDMQRYIDEEIAKVVREGVTPRELERAQNSIRARFLDQLASVNDKADLLNSYNYLVGEPDWARQDAARFDRVTAEDVRRVAEQYLQKAGRVTLTVVPQGKTDMKVTAGAGGTP